MLYKYGGILFGCVLIFYAGYLLADRKAKITQQKIESSYSDVIKTNLDDYNKSLKKYESQILWLQQNNITTVKTVYLPSGKKIVTKVIDKSINRHTETSVAQETHEEKKTESIAHQIIASSSTEVTKPFLTSYKVGFTASYDDFKNANLTGGVRIGSLPILLTVQAPPIATFYKKLSIGAEFEF